MVFGVSVFPCETVFSAGKQESFRNERVGAAPSVEIQSSVPGFVIESDGMIFPGCYTEYEAVEKMFASPKRMLYYLSKNDDIAIELDTDIITKVHYQDSEIANSLGWLCQEKFNCGQFSRLPIEKKYLMAKELKRRYGCAISQIARVTGLDPKMLNAMLA